MPIAFPATLWSTANTSNGTTSNVVTTRALEQWVIAANATTSNGSLSSVATVNGNYTLTGTNVSVATDSAGFQYMQFSGSSTSYLTANRTIKDVGIDITSGAEWHAVVSYPDAAPHYVFRLLEVGGEGRAHLRVYRGATKDYTAWPEAGQSGGVSSNYTASTGDKIILSAWRNAATGEIGIGVNGQTWTSTIATATSLARNLFSFWDYNFGGKRCRVYESLGYIDNLTTTERTATINALKAKYNDPNYANVSLLLHFDGANGSTTFTDSSPNALTATANGSVAITTLQSMFGGSSANFPGSSYLSFASNPVFAISATQDFTIECWVRFNSVANCGFFQGLTNLVSASGQMWFGYYGGTLTLGRHGSGTYNVNYSWTPSANTWYHVAACRSGGTTRLFIDGAVVATSTANSGQAYTQSGACVGVTASPVYFNGQMDEFRLTMFAKYTSAFTPTGPFPNS